MSELDDDVCHCGEPYEKHTEYGGCSQFVSMSGWSARNGMKCPPCNGSGEVEAATGGPAACRVCGGNGEISEERRAELARDMDEHYDEMRRTGGF